MKAKRSDNFDKFANKKKEVLLKKNIDKKKSKQKKIRELLVKLHVKEKKISKEVLQLNH
jgi:hypothetical protein